MDTQRTILAIALSFLVLLGYQYFFIPPQSEEPQQVQVPAEKGGTPAASTPEPGPATPSVPAAPAAISAPAARQAARAGRDLRIDSELFTAIITEGGGGLKSLELKNYKQTTAPDSKPVELVKTEAATELPLYFSWGAGPDQDEVPVYTADRDKIDLTAAGQQKNLTMKAQLASGLTITRTMSFEPADYLITMAIEVANPTAQPLQGAPFVCLTNRPFSEASASRYLFNGPALLVDNLLQEVKPSDLEKAPKNLQGKITWAAYEDTYFMAGMLPAVQENLSARLSAAGDKVSVVLAGATETIPAQSKLEYKYRAYLGPKKLSILKQHDAGLERIVNFGWFDVIAKPTLYLLNFISRYLHNYGVAIILVTVLFKALFWPIAQKGMKSMRNMQKIQPKIAKLREKFKDDPTRMNQEMMTLYKTYKINPLGGCLPMILQIPVFFALYKVLLQSIELRHAPFMLWITDLSAPDRLWAALHIPYLGGIPVLTLLMGASMFAQQKLSPAPADPAQAKMMMFLPLIFTFMFINFSSGLVLYWFVNNLLSIAQQYMVNRAKDV